jgi:hypothetical protein
MNHEDVERNRKIKAGRRTKIYNAAAAARTKVPAHPHEGKKGLVPPPASSPLPFRVTARSSGQYTGRQHIHNRLLFESRPRERCVNGRTRTRETTHGRVEAGRGCAAPWDVGRGEGGGEGDGRRRRRRRRRQRRRRR